MGERLNTHIPRELAEAARRVSGLSLYAAVQRAVEWLIQQRQIPSGETVRVDTQIKDIAALDRVRLGGESRAQFVQTALRGRYGIEPWQEDVKEMGSE